MVGFSRFKLLIGIFITFFAFFLMSHNTSALTLTPNNVNFNYNTTANGAFDWSAAKNIPGQGQPVGSESYISPVKSLRYMQFSYQPIAIDGNHAALHFEANVVYIKNSLQATMIWQYLSSQQITSCFSNSTYLNIENQALSFAQTSWDNGYRNTLTIYGDVTLSGLPSGSTGQSINCNFGNSANTFFTSDLPTATSIYLEQNPTSIVFSNNLNDALLAQQIAQFEVQIQLQNQMNDKLDDLSSQSQQNAQDIIDNQNQNAQDIIKSNQNCYENLMPLSGVDLSQSRTVSISGLSLSPGTYTLSYDLNDFSMGSTSRFSLFLWIDDLHLTILSINSNTSLGRKTYTFELPSSGGSNSSFRLATDAYNGGAWVKLNKIQLEAGSSATTYTPYGEERCVNVNQEYYNEQRQADQNISNQNSSDIQGAENQQTTNLIGVLSNFVTQLTNFQATTCELTLPFPSFVGGNQVVNICQGKDVLGNFITVIGTLIMITFYIPLVISILKMIYNEIRSFTNG